MDTIITLNRQGYILKLTAEELFKIQNVSSVQNAVAILDENPSLCGSSPDLDYDGTDVRLVTKQEAIQLGELKTKIYKEKMRICYKKRTDYLGSRIREIDYTLEIKCIHCGSHGKTTRGRKAQYLLFEMFDYAKTLKMTVHGETSTFILDLKHVGIIRPKPTMFFNQLLQEYEKIIRKVESYTLKSFIIDKHINKKNYVHIFDTNVFALIRQFLH